MLKLMTRNVILMSFRDILKSHTLSNLFMAISLLDIDKYKSFIGSRRVFAYLWKDLQLLRWSLSLTLPTEL